ncbi:hypothetical protein K9N68_14200 [Kovacikia minuta CCNUW1]|uniref:hypothetical protein n=1 Tax=Kovacikia minuta TaxID=2931930 RepID=UPI001CCCD39D|nr:hypothetical protein [Kovacikia minuta]UBF28885.1 hypothetical protein K9N68_14200 [Kovacikia minuta CCNUW1]
MARANNGETPLGYYESAIAETLKIREEFQSDRKNLEEIKAANKRLEAELQQAKAEIQKLEIAVSNYREEFQTLVLKNQMLQSNFGSLSGRN